ncbi:uncharacterized protein PAC_05665 [Phialocephala subalpina]|uniref:Uncharacterized protein n=1 Tax=Phialocephala subalpina TaxID=576137 RepID=A0A1L7WSP2_9HELO|nr:uncharacterized protein PAC_05665 [Phialocephala subalpina]
MYSDPSPLSQILKLQNINETLTALADALALLGITPIYHMREVKKNGHEKYWLPLLEVHFANPPRPISKEDFDEFLGDFAGVTDIPASVFASEFMDAYPDAKIVLTTRSSETWLTSMKSTIWHVKTSPFGQAMGGYLWGPEENREEEGIARFERHNEAVRKAAKERGREILEFEVKEGWGPLCAFLGLERPEGVGVGFPRSDDWAQYKWKNVEKEDMEKAQKENEGK